MRILVAIFLLSGFVLMSACGQRSDAGDAPLQAFSTETAEEPAFHPTDTLAGTFTIDYLTGHFDPATHPDFVRVADQYTDGDTYYLRKEAYEAFQRMHAAALEDGVRLLIISATRNFDRQKVIWEAKWQGSRLLEGRESAPLVYPDPVNRALAILRYSAMPGTSRHHWGTDIDLNRLTNDYFGDGEGQRIYDWLTAHAAEFGFCQPYMPKGEARPDGYNEEKWHWSYLPVARHLTDLARSELRNEQISGFAGAEAAIRIDVVRKYVLGISEACQEWPLGVSE